MESERLLRHRLGLRRVVGVRETEARPGSWQDLQWHSQYPRKSTNFFFPVPNRVSNSIVDWIGFGGQVNNVGTNVRKPTTEYSTEEYLRLMSVNLESSYHLCQLAHPLLKKSGAGSVVFVSSVAGVLHIGSGSIYGLSKGRSSRARKPFDKSPD
ncbi:unnamed protein product [Linum tenue]|uniref:Uncharacterized protein n=1 Tax=Linum tenue TaxID=586396 RepID=A0AAV0MAF7_9ROSI|nr:unnamed protein product [Linum tenue]